MLHGGQAAGGGRPHPGRSADGRKPRRLPRHTVNRTRRRGVVRRSGVRRDTRAAGLYLAEQPQSADQLPRRARSPRSLLSVPRADGVVICGMCPAPSMDCWRAPASRAPAPWCRSLAPDRAALARRTGRPGTHGGAAGGVADPQGRRHLPPHLSGPVRPGGRSWPGRPRRSSPRTPSTPARCSCAACTCCSSSSTAPGACTWPGSSPAQRVSGSATS